MAFETICVIGLGYIGLPTASILASRKRRVFGVDINRRAVDTINRGEVHIIEPELDVVVRAAVASGHLTASEQPSPADAFMIAVPTPFRAGHEPDLAYVEAAARAVAPCLRAGNLVVLESTSPVGTTEQVSHWLAAARPDLSFPHLAGEQSDVRVAYCPERVLPGHVMRELVQNDRIIGGMTPRCSQAAVELYRAFVEGECVVSDARTAEMCKLTENSFRDVNIAFANELSVVCHRLGIDVWELIRLANRHPRVSILNPGPGVGGHCIAVDPWFIVSSAPEQARLIRTAREVNDAKPEWVLERIAEAVDACARENGRRAVVACLGLSFKPDIDDLRESPALEIVERLAKAGGCEVLAVEPHIKALPPKLAAHAVLVDVAQALARADVVVMLVDHRQFKAVPRESLAGRRVVDTRGAWRA